MYAALAKGVGSGGARRGMPSAFVAAPAAPTATPAKPKRSTSVPVTRKSSSPKKPPAAKARASPSTSRTPRAVKVRVAPLKRRSTSSSSESRRRPPLGPPARVSPLRAGSPSSSDSSGRASQLHRAYFSRPPSSESLLGLSHSRSTSSERGRQFLHAYKLEHKPVVQSRADYIAEIYGGEAGRPNRIKRGPFGATMTEAQIEARRAVRAAALERRTSGGDGLYDVWR